MNTLELDRRFTFDSFVVSPANRLAAAAAKRVAEAPGAAYNPLFVYSASGLGKTHLVTAIGQHAQRLFPGLAVGYDTSEHLLEGVTAAIQAGERDAFRGRLRDADVLILDDVQFLSGQRTAQEELLRALDALSARGGQVVLASDRPPIEIDGLDGRLLSRFSGGLIVDLAAPDYETRVAIVKRKAEERGQPLGEGVAEAIARVPYGNVRELQGGLNRVLAVQELDAREVGVGEVETLLGHAASPAAAADEFGSFLADVSGALGAAIADASPEQDLADAILQWRSAGYRTQRLEVALAGSAARGEVDTLLADFAADVARLDAIAEEIGGLDGDARELTRFDVLRNPERLDEAEALLAQVRERLRPLPGPPPSNGFDEVPLDGSLFAVRAARAIAAAPGGAYNPFYVYGSTGRGKSALLAALGNAARAQAGNGEVVYMRGASFCADVVTALERNLLDSWRTRLRRARVLILDDIDGLAGTERAQEELFHLFDDLRGAGVQLVFAATVPPRELDGIEPRLRTRLESGLVADLDEPAGGNHGATLAKPDPARVSIEPSAPFVAVPAIMPSGEPEAEATPEPTSALDDWFLRREKVLWQWPDPGDLIIEELN
jgi:chromosomal replication initiator protein